MNSITCVDFCAPYHSLDMEHLTERVINILMSSAVKLKEFNFISFMGSQRVRHNLMTEHEHQEVRLELQCRTSGWE